MKIAILSAYDHYGAGSAAYRLFQGLKQIGCKVDMYCGIRKHSDVIEIPSGLEKLTISYEIQKKITEKNAPFSPLCFGLDDSVLEKITADADVVNIHWVNGFISVDNIKMLAKRGKRIAITMHDENYYTGGCHYTNGCFQYMQGCKRCELINGEPALAESIFNSKEHSFPQGVVFITPSRWLENKASKSRILSDYRIETIPNGIDSRIFNPEGRFITRKWLGFQDDDFIILFGSVNLAETRKGTTYLMRLSEQLRGKVENKNIRYVAVGKASCEFENKDIKLLDYIQDEKQLAGIYAAADVLVIPSLEDNFPNVMLEAMLCGTQVIGFNTGGIPEGIIDGKNGYIVEKGNVEGLKNAVLKVLSSNGGMRKATRQNAVNKFDIKVMAHKYEELFRRLDIAKCEDNTLNYLMQKALDFELLQKEQLKKWLEQAHENTRQEHAYLEKEIWLESIFSKAIRIINREHRNGRSIALYGIGRNGRYLLETMDSEVNYLIDVREIDDDRYISPDKISMLKETLPLIIVTPDNPDELIGTLKDNGFNESSDYIVMSRLEER